MKGSVPVQTIFGSMTAWGTHSIRIQFSLKLTKKEYALKVDSFLPEVGDLIGSASKYAQSTIDAYGVPENDRVFFMAGVSLEHLLKACLARRHPALILDLKQKDSWSSLYSILVNQQSHSKKMRTISLSEALDRVNILVPTNAHHPDLLALIDLRNGAVHLGVSQPVEERILVAFLRQVSVCLFDLEVSDNVFWASHLDIVQALLSEETSRVKRDVARKKSQSILRFDQKTEGWTVEMKEIASKSLMNPLFGMEPYKCVVCGSDGQAYGDHDIQYDAENDDNGEMVINDVWVEFTPESFKCSSCGLHLSSVEEFIEAGFSDEAIISKLDMNEVISEINYRDYLRENPWLDI